MRYSIPWLSFYKDLTPRGFEPLFTDRKSVVLDQARRWGHLKSQKMVRADGFEPSTPALKGRCSAN